MCTFKCRTTQKCAPQPPHASRPPSRAALPPASTACHFFVNGGSTSRLLCAKPAAPPQLGENEHDDRHVPIESHVVITTDTHPINSRARGAGWVAWFGFSLRERSRLGGKCQKAPWCCGAFVMKLRSSCPPICAWSAGTSRCFVRCRGVQRTTCDKYDTSVGCSAAKGPAFLQKTIH